MAGNDFKSLVEEVKACKACPLHESATQKVFGRGSRTPKIVFLGNAPNIEEDVQGLPLVGRPGELLDRWIEFLGLGKEDYAVLNACKCRSPEDRIPTSTEISACVGFLGKQIELLKPTIIVALGASALKAVSPGDQKISTVAGKFLENGFCGARVYSTHHPNYFLNKGETGARAGEAYLEGLKASFTPIPGTKEGPLKPLKPAEKQAFVPLHLHTEYSLGDGYGKPRHVAAKLKEKGFDTAAITDHGSLAGTLYFQQAMIEAGLKPIVGIEAYVVDNYDKDAPYYHLVLLAKDKTGWQNLLWLNGKAVNEGFYYRPRMLIKDVLTHSEGLICTTACTSGLVSKRVIAGELVLADLIVTELKGAFCDDLYLEIIFNDNVPGQKEANQFLLRQAAEKNIKTVVSSDGHYPDKEDESVHRAIKAISMRKKYSEAGFSDKTFYYLTDNDIMELSSRHPYVTPEAVKQMIATTREVAAKCNFLIVKEQGSLLPDMMGFINDEAFKTWLANPGKQWLAAVGEVTDE